MAKKANGSYALVIVESPAKARTIEGYLGDGFVVESSVGHIRDLPSSAREIPSAVSSEPWARLGVNVDEDFAPLYVIPASKQPQVTKLRKLLKNADALFLACDEDREGEAIAWHLTEVLKPKVPVRRMVFDEITRPAIEAAIESTRDIDQRLVSAQESRRILDRLYGYEISPVLWRKVKPKLSAGRVQSVATRLVVERERIRMRFHQSEYWDLEAEFKTDEGKLTAGLIELGDLPVATGRHFVETTGELEDPSAVAHLQAEDATQLTATLREQTFTVSQVTEKPFTNKPYAPFITSTMQQEAGRKLRFTAQRTMRLAQSLYENGFITYMRTDSTTLSSQALNAARSQVAELYGQQYLPDEPRVYRSRSKNAQEAHEAVRPAGEAFRTPKQVSSQLDADQLKLYDLIWKRTVASQMKDAHGMRTNVRISAPTPDRGNAVFSTSGKVITFPGFLRAYVEGSDDPAAALDDQEKVLPPVKQDQVVATEKIEPQQHFTQPKGRYTEASLIREMEERGIGRPSTYASIIQTIQDRGYVRVKGSALVPTFTAFAVVNLLEKHLPDLVDYGFTARMEDGLDTISRGETDAVPWLHDFYFGEQNSTGGDRLAEVGLKDLIGSHADEIDPRSISAIPLGKTPAGEDIVCRVGRYGPYIQIGEQDLRATVPDEIAPDELTVERAVQLLHDAEQGDKELGIDPQTDKPVYMKTGRFGPYVQLGDPELTPKGNVKAGGKPKMASLWPTMSIESVTIEEALMLLSFPREVGEHPETNEVITAQDGRYGPYIKMGTESRSLPDHDKLATVTIEEAVELLKQPSSRGRSRSGGTTLAELGNHPTSELPISVKSGRYGNYVTDGEVNATIPKEKEPEDITLDQAVELIAIREQKMRDQGKDPRAKKTPKKKAAKKKAAKKKPAKKKAAKKKAAKKKAATE
ncbi:MAG: type I DNA topoisomerase [Gemmatimonadetes bacterium]|jgi:DNA topoisomerase-1|nr:type I DNA topoisomerase [Gemmatimonadota bacterium]MBT5144675.1 type I DNA topoisomerase [Gemmatimonadota bacterium]MBT5587364.1 type I DNA topoisomerase [Gemmatimonadota bacterium]MBT5963286.1 type I DNA topoisomerase [Gemmatimonadota bacterium]MBT7596400.1 type I DNA topoisomerase [Gemmatimonadota bacterium]